MTIWFRSRIYIFLALVLTLLALFALVSRDVLDAQWMLRWNAVDSGQVQFIYGILAVVLILMLPFALRIQTALQRGRVSIIVVAVIASFLSIFLLEPSQEHRVFITPFSIWVIIAHILSLAALLVLWSKADADSHQLIFTARLVPYLLGGTLIIVLILHIVGISEFVSFDLPDEPFNASIATNYALNGDLSSQYIGSAYGSPDVVFPRYYLVMGIWLKLVGSTSLAALRAFPLLVGLLAVGLFAWVLGRLRGIIPFTRTHILVGMIVLLSSSTFLRTSHNLRMDILLALYSVLMIWGMIGFWGQPKPQVKYLLLMGFALFLGMEAIPLAAIPLSFSTGVMLIVWWLMQPHKRSHLRFVVIYAIACVVGIATYYLFQLLPNVGESWGRYQEFVLNYTGVTGAGSVRLPFNTLVDYLGRFSLILSPVELIASLVAIIIVWQMKRSVERWMFASVALGFALMFVLSRMAYSYMVIFAPFMAYAIMRACSPTGIEMNLYGHISNFFKPIFLFVALLAIVAVPMIDLASAISTRPNQSRLDTIAVLTPEFTPDTTVVGEDIFWFTLHEKHKFLGINGL